MILKLKEKGNEIPRVFFYLNLFCAILLANISVSEFMAATEHHSQYLLNKPDRMIKLSAPKTIPSDKNIV